MKVLGISCSFWHDPSAALLVDGEIVAAVEQERFSRRKHAVGELPLDAIRYCLDTAGLKPEDIDLVAYPWSIASIEQNRFRYIARSLGRRTKKALKMLVGARRQQRSRLEKLEACLAAMGLKPSYGEPSRAKGTVEVECVEHHLAHASSAYHFSGFDDAAVMTIDGMGEITTCLFGHAHGGKIDKIHEIQKPDSLGLFYAAMTEYLGFEHNDGEYKVMGMASYGDASKIDLADLITSKDGDLRLDLDYCWSPRSKRYQADKPFGKKLVERFGPPRTNEDIDEPYIHIAAAVQKRLEDATIELLDYHLKPVLERSRRLCFAGGCALNVILNRKLMAHPLVDELWVQPGAGDTGVSLGAASYAAARRGEKIKKQEHSYLGPRSTSDEVARELDSLRIPYERLEDAPGRAAELLSQGEVVAWFQGRMEWGPRALGNRSILGNPGKKGIADDINGRIKYRERWRPFCPSIMEEKAAEVLGSGHPSPFMTHSFKVADAWKDKIPEVVHVDGTARPQVVSKATNPRFHRVIAKLFRRTGLPCVVNTSLNRRGEPIVMTPKDALAMFYGSGLEFLIMEDILVSKEAPSSEQRPAKRRVGVGAPEISVVVSTYERPTELARVLEGYRLQTFKDFEVVVADDGSGPETKAVVERYQGTGLKVVHARHEHDGFRAAAARNMGVRASSGQWIVFADGDCVPFPSFLEEHARARDGGSFLAGERYLLEEDEARAVTVEAVASGEAFERAPVREKRRLRGIAAKNAFYRATFLKPDRPKLLTSNCSVGRAAFASVNGLDERYRGWGREDDDLRRRLVRSGLRARSLVGRANLLHLWHPPVASFKGTVRAGPNEPYFQRGFFLSRCRTGLERRPLASLAFAIACADPALARLARSAIQKNETDSAGPCEVELLLDDPRSPPPRFAQDSEVRVLVQEAPPALTRTKGAHVIVHGADAGAPVPPAVARFTASYGRGPLAGSLARVAEILDEVI